MTLRSVWAALLLILAAFDAAGQGTLEMHYAEGKVSVRADQVPLKTILQRLARQADIRLHLAEGVGDTLVSWSFRDMPLESALMALVAPNDMVFYEQEYGAHEKDRVASLYVLPPGSPVPGNAAIANLPVGAGTESEAQRLGYLIVKSGDMSLRRKAIDDLAALNSPDATRELEAALSVHEPELRQEVVMALGQAYGDKPPTGLGQVVMGDKDAQVRDAAVLALADLGGEVARLFIEEALKDQEESVRETARMALSGMPKR